MTGMEGAGPAWRPGEQGSGCCASRQRADHGSPSGIRHSWRDYPPDGRLPAGGAQPSKSVLPVWANYLVIVIRIQALNRGV